MSEALKQALAKRGERFVPTTARSVRAASVVPGSANGDTVRWIVATSSVVTRSYYDWWDDETIEYDEVIPVANCRLPSVSSRSINLLDTHNWWSCAAIIGLGTEFKVAGETIEGEFALSKRSGVADIVEGIREGIIVNGSAGYEILRYTVSYIDGRMTITADEWELLEFSAVPVPADGKSQMMRSASELIAAHRSAHPKNPGKPKMTEEQIRALVVESVRTAMATAPAPVVESDTDKAAREAIEAGTRAAPKPNSLPAPENQPKAGQRSAEEQAAVDGLRATAKRYGVETEFVEFEKTGADLVELRGIVSNGMRSKSNRTEIDGLNGGTGKREQTMADLRWEDTAAYRGHAKA